MQRIQLIFLSGLVEYLNLHNKLYPAEPRKASPKELYLQHQQSYDFRHLGQMQVP